MKLIFGNNYAEIKNPRGKYKNKKLVNVHRWCMFLSIDNSKELTESYISHVVYHLHPTYKNNRIKVKEHPFILCRTAYGKFVVGVEVHFQDWLECKPIRLDYLLNFEEIGTHHSKVVQAFYTDD